MSLCDLVAKKSAARFQAAFPYEIKDRSQLFSFVSILIP